MIISKIITDSCIYYHLHAEQTVTGAFLDEPGLGILEKEITHTTWDNIIEDCNKHQSLNHDLVLNFESLERCQNNSIGKIVSVKKLFRNIIFINIKNTIIESLDVSLYDNKNNIKNDTGYDVFYLSDNYKLNFESSTSEIFEKAFKLYLLKYLEVNSGENILHHSSSVYLSKYINLKKFISLDREFFLYSIYHLAIKTYLHWNELFKNFTDSSHRPILVCQNLNSSYITSVLSSLLKLDIIILDQIGPINKLYSTLDNKIEESQRYLVVSDLVCLGTEVKVAKSLIEFLGGKYLGSISIIRIETINPIHKSYDNTECVFEIKKENNSEIGYMIKTALDI